MAPRPWALLGHMLAARGRGGVRWRLAVFAAAVLVIVLYRSVGAHLRAIGLLLRFADEHASGLFAGFGQHPVETIDATLDGRSGVARARLYVPRGVDEPGGIVVAHGIHR